MIILGLLMCHSLATHSVSEIPPNINHARCHCTFNRMNQGLLLRANLDLASYYLITGIWHLYNAGAHYFVGTI